MEFLDKISISKEIIDNMTKNNKRNREKYRKSLEELKEEYTKIKEEIYNEINKRYSEKVGQIKENPEIEQLKKSLVQMDENLFILNPTKTPYEKMNLDENIWRLKRFYKDNLENVNKEILQCINSFEKFGVKLTPADFTYSRYAREYMKVFFEEKDNLNSKKLKKAFEEIYWKCPEIITHLELNIRYIYLINENKLEKYFEKEETAMLRKFDLTSEKFFEKYMDLKSILENAINVDQYTILNKFINKQVNLNDFMPNKIEKEYAKIIDIHFVKEDKETKENILKFYNNIYEFKNYLRFKFIFDDIKKHYLQKEQYKKIYEDTLRKIQIEERKLDKFNEQKSRKFFFFKKKDDDENLQYADLIKNIQNLYKELDKAKVYNKIYTDLDDSTTIYDVFKFANSFKTYVRDISIIYIPTITPEEIDELIIGFDNFVKSTNIQIINNILMKEEKDISLIIKDRYSLLKFNITKDDVQEDNIDDLYQILSKLKLDINIEKANMNISQISEIMSLYETIK